MVQSLFESDRVPSRTRRQLVITIGCVLLVVIAALFHRRTGACGTGHYLLFQLLGGMFVSMVVELWRFPHAARAAQVLAYVLNVAVFVFLLYLWHRRSSESRYAFGVIAITAIYLSSYFFLLPTVDCP